MKRALIFAVAIFVCGYAHADLRIELKARTDAQNAKKAKDLGHYEIVNGLKAELISKLGARVIADQSTFEVAESLTTLNILIKTENGDICSGSANKFGPGFDRTVSVSVQCYDVDGNKTKEISWNDRK
jgi:hypothetical protein